MPRAEGRCPGLSAGQAAASSAPHALSLLLLLACCANACRGMPTSPQRLQPEKELQLWNEINEACSSFLSIDSQPQAFVALRELCRVVMKIFQKPQEQSEKDNTKRFLFHYSKIQKSGNSNVVEGVFRGCVCHKHADSSVCKRTPIRASCLHVGQIILRGIRSPFTGQSRGYFLFRPRNGKRSAGII